MKKIIISLLVANMLLLGACGNQNNQNVSSTDKNEEKAIISQEITTEPNSTVATINEKDCINICQNYLSENNSAEVSTVTNWDHPIITMIEKLPDNYYKISDDTNSEKYFKVVFTTTDDEVLGSIDFFVDDTGNIIGQNYRK